MANPHSSVKYVEPNYVFDELAYAAGDGERHDRAPDLEDYCIALDIVVEISSKQKALRDEMSSDNKVIIMSYKDNSKGKTSVSFMSGTRIGGYKKNNEGEYSPKLRGENVLTSYYADMYVTDLVDYGTTELLGIKSVNVEYNSTCVPIVSIKFTDVRGMSIFQPSEINDDTVFNGIRGFSKDNIAQSFFHAFFTLPLPRFTIYLKGFYGQPVGYEVMCDKFETAFDSNTGSFDVDTRFIGFAYSFMSDVSLNVLLAAPYSDFEGENYWATQVSNGKFTIPNKDGVLEPMPKLYDIRMDIETIANSSDEDLNETPYDLEEENHFDEIRDLNGMRDMYRKWYDELYKALVENYGSDYCYAIGGENEDIDYQAIFVLTNGKKIGVSDSSSNINDLSSEYGRLNPTFRELNGTLIDAIKKYNSSTTTLRALEEVNPKFAYSRMKIFKEVWINDRTNKYVFDGFHQDNRLPKEETIYKVFGDNEESQQRALDIIYGDGSYQYIDAFVIDLNYTMIKTRIKALEESIKANENVDAAKRKALNRHMYQKMRWYPTIENFTKIVMAHLETLMHMIYRVEDMASGRTLSQLGVTSGEFGVVDDNSKDDQVAPFPRITSLIYDADGYTKSEDTWVGNFNAGIGFSEVEIVNGLFNGVEKISEIEGLIELSQRNAQENANAQEQQAPLSVIKYPLTSYDFLLTSNPYGDDMYDNIEGFIGKVCMRMEGILSLSFFRAEFKDEWMELAEQLGAVEAHNMYEFGRIKDVRLLQAISVNGAYGDADGFLNVALGITSQRLPWEDANGGGKELFSVVNKNKRLWLTRYTRYCGDTIPPYPYMSLHPIQNMSYEKLNECLNEQWRGETDDVLASYITPMYNSRELREMLDGTMEMCPVVKFTDRFKEVWAMLENTDTTTGDIGYSDIVEKIIDSVRPLENARELKGIIYEDKDDKIPFCLKVSVNNDKKSKVSDKRSGALPSGEVEQGNAVLGTNTYSMSRSRAYKWSDTKYEFEKSNEDQYLNEMFAGSINSFTITECYGYKTVNGKKELDKSKSLFLMKDFYNVPLSFVKEDLTKIVDDYCVQDAYFLIGIDCINYDCVADVLLNGTNSKSFTYLPNLAFLQLGAIMAASYGCDGIGGNFKIDVLKKYIPLPTTFGKKIIKALNEMDYRVVFGFIKYFRDWCFNNNNRILKLSLTEYVKDNDIIDYEKIKNDNYLRFFVTGGDDYSRSSSAADRRALFNQDADVVKDLSNELMKMACMVKCNVFAIDPWNETVIENDKFGASVGAAISRALEDSVHREEKIRIQYSFDKGYAIKYIEGFLNALRELNNMPTDTGDPTTMAKSPIKTTDDMKIELYRYLKQLYDKWACSTKSSYWSSDSFFDDGNNGGNPLGGNFYFIDSFFNKIGDKLLLNPMKLSEMIKFTTAAMDTNTMMYDFLAHVYGEHRCMIKCVQNFRTLPYGMDSIFRPIPYNSMKRDDHKPDFVVVYSYEASRNLNVANSEYKDDGFMLNDEFESPVPITSRSNEKNYYKIPAFGVTYGRQYQHYFKNISVNMSHPVMTEQAIIAKHNVLANSRAKTYKNATAQDLYDIYSNQSYTCTIDMMGCTYIQPLMYFVLLNVPFFKGSYLVSKVRHSMTPGNMSTEVTGVRMSKYCNKMVTDIFTDEDSENFAGGYSDDEYKYKLADTSNDCPYKVFPIVESLAGVELNETQAKKAKKIMSDLIRLSGNKITPIGAAGVVGNMWQEMGPDFDHTKVVTDSDGFPAGGMCGWNDRYYNLTNMINMKTDRYGKDERKLSETIVKDLKTKLQQEIVSSANTEHQLTFLLATLTKVTTGDGCKNEQGKPCMFSIDYLNGKGVSNYTPEDAALRFRNAYERGADIAKRKAKASYLYNMYTEGDNFFKKTEEGRTSRQYTELFFNAIQKSLNSTEKYADNLKVRYFDDKMQIYASSTNGNVILNGWNKYKNAVKNANASNDKFGVSVGAVVGNLAAKAANGNSGGSTAGSEKLAVLFDIILNTPEYYKHVKWLNWLITNSPDEYPRSISLGVSENVVQTRTILVGTGGDEIESTNRFTGEECNQKLMQSLGKKYGSDKALFVKECPQFSNAKDSIDNFKPKDCISVQNDELVSHIDYTPPTSSYIKIGDWDVGKSVKWIVAHDVGCRTSASGKKKCGNSKCAQYVENAIAYGGFPDGKMSCTEEHGNGNAYELRYKGILKKHHFDLLQQGELAPRGDINFNLQAGDVCIIGNSSSGGNHACMWTGNKWASDFLQEHANVYGSTQPYALYRYMSSKPGEPYTPSNS